jgi:hypothetical protein
MKSRISVIFLYIEGVGIAMGWTAGVRFSAGVRNVSLLHNVKIQPPIQWVPQVLFPGLDRPWREADHSPPSAEVKNGGAVPAFPHTSSWIKYREKFMFIVTIYALINVA